MTFEMIINDWTAALEKDAQLFTSVAKKVAEHDGVLRDSNRSISELTDNVLKLCMDQEEVDDNLTAVTNRQGDLEAKLDVLEKDIDAVFASRSNLSPQDADIQRELAYQRAIDVYTRLDAVKSSTAAIANDLNANSENNNAEGSLGKIVQILNAHFDTLSYIENKSKEIEREVENLNRVSN
jgi:chromosome segregation ATPase